MADYLTTGVLGNAKLIHSFTKSIPTTPEMTFSTLIAAVERRADDVQAGDLKSLETMLTCQSMALDAMFLYLSERAINSGLLNQYDIFMRLALKAQNQCRTTLETLATIKKPRQTVITHQANISNGPQQVNNTPPQHNGHQALADTTQPHLLSNEHTAEQWLDTGTASTAGSSNQAIAALDKVNRAENRGR